MSFMTTIRAGMWPELAPKLINDLPSRAAYHLSTGQAPTSTMSSTVGTQAAMAYQNSLGGVCGRQIQVLSGDDSLDSGKNRAAHLALKDSVFAFVGSFSVNDDGGASVMSGAAPRAKATSE